MDVKPLQFTGRKLHTPILLLIAFALILAGIVVTIAKVKQYVVQNTEHSGNGPIELSGEIIQKDYPISDFKKLKVEGAVSLTLAKGENNSLKIKADSAIFKCAIVINSFRLFSP